MATERSTENQVTPETPKSIRIGSGVYHHKSTDLVTNDMLEAHKMKTRKGNPIDSEFILKTTRIRERYHLSAPGAEADMGSKALVEALDQKDWNVNDLDYLIVATSWTTQESVADEIYNLVNTVENPPSKPELLHTFAACSGFVQTLHELKNRRSHFEGKKIAIVATEHYQPHVEGFEQAIFGSHAAAVVGRFGSGIGADFDVIGSESVDHPELQNLIRMRVLEPSEYVQSQCLYYQPLPHPQSPLDPDFVMDGPAVFGFTLGNENYSTVENALKEAQISISQIDAIYTHQANGRTNERIKTDTKAKGFTGSVPSNIEKWGNTSSASIPLLIHEDRVNGKIKSGSTVLVWAFGAGIKTAAAVVVFK